MRYAIISDIHGNLEAFQAVLGRIAQYGIGRILCLGDLVGYNADPNACVEIVRQERITSILGNHDAVACGRANDDTFTPLAQEAIRWTKERLTPENRDFLRALPREQQVDNLFLCHGTVHDTNHYILNQDDATKAFQLMNGMAGKPRICFHGHSHLPSAFRFRHGTLYQELDNQVDMNPFAEYLINPGSVGQPRDGDPRAAFAIYEEENSRTIFFRVDYDRETCQNKIIAAGLPSKLALRLELGR